MNTKAKLKELSNNSKNEIYKDVVMIFYKKWYISRWIINQLYINNISNYLLYPNKVIKDITQWDYDSYYSKNKGEIKTILNIWFKWFKPYKLKFEHWRKLAVKYTIRYHYYKILKEFRY